jgi:glyoxalase superfamily protein
VSTRLTAVVVDALDAPAQARFWARALQWQLAEANLFDTQVAVRPANADGIGFLFISSARPKTTENRLHFDLCGGSGEARLVHSLLDLGATRVDIGQGEVPWEVLADPEGNEFCVLPEAGSDRLAAICLDAANPADQGRFWATATGWPIVDEGEWGVSLRSSAHARPALVMGPPVAPKQGKNRLYLDLAPHSGDDTSAEVTRLLHAGASRVDVGRGQASWQMLADPEGNEFRVLRPQRPKPSAH